MSNIVTCGYMGVVKWFN